MIYPSVKVEELYNKIERAKQSTRQKQRIIFGTTNHVLKKSPNSKVTSV
jgi:hypothetical protein